MQTLRCAARSGDTLLSPPRRPPVLQRTFWSLIPAETETGKPSLGASVRTRRCWGRRQQQQRRMGAAALLLEIDGGSEGVIFDIFERYLVFFFFSLLFVFVFLMVEPEKGRPFSLHLCSASRYLYCRLWSCRSIISHLIILSFCPTKVLYCLCSFLFFMCES